MVQTVLDIPILRWGRTYESLETSELRDYETGAVVARMSLANAGLVRRDLRFADRASHALRAIEPESLYERLERAGELFLRETLGLGQPDHGALSPQQYVALQSATTGLPEVLCRQNMEKVAFVLRHLRTIIESLCGGVPLAWLREGYGQDRTGLIVSYQLQSPVLGAVLPNNSPGVHTLWLPALPLSAGVVLKPGSQEPWTPFRVSAALIAAGLPPEALALYPGDHDVADAVLGGCGRALVFGGSATVERYRANPTVQVHGPGFSKILIGQDCVDRWETYLDLMAESVLSNGGRSCINCSGIWVPHHGRAIAEALAERLARIEVRDRTDPQAILAAFTNAQMARQINALIEAGLQEPGVEDLTARYRREPRLVDRSSYAYLLPTVVYCPSPECKLANQEFLFPFVSVVECPQEQVLARIGPTLVCTAITYDASFRRQLLDCTAIDRLNLGPIPTHRVDWRQPHEGNLVRFLYKHRALQLADESGK